MTPQQLHVLQHSMGLDEYGRGSKYRNRYVCDPQPLLESLVALGFMYDNGALQIADGMHVYCVTPAGEDAIERESPKAPKAPKVSRSRQRYLDFLSADTGETFIEWLRRRKEVA